ncbi:O-antigen ligase family protein [Bythopirellula polymerisocia]|uniref:O-Antigen ligase n=1 Tax=Bythopirellula polymerisocia TaxID=2528003 RepID=A0A5C6CUG2_9BACT|nr:O-antigen ligase family protein [Bythopirellula polymerisocia]TWU27294.1 O-Antigen ligase [Bythopirellula polymerisocia]
MEIVIAIFAVAAVAWAFVYARHGSLLVGCTLFVTLGYIFTRDFWQAHIGPVPLTVDRLLLSALVVLFFWRWRRGLLSVRSLSVPDCLGGMLLIYLAIRWAFTSAPPLAATSVSPSWRLIASFFMPAMLYWIVSNSELNYRQWKWLLAGLSMLGVYLAFTGIAEVKGQWWAVFPQFISNPSLGAHFGRARGPALMSASLGVYLSICFWAAWFLWAERGRWGRLLLVGAMLLMCGALYYTYTRSCWLGLAVGLAIIPFVHFPKQWRPWLFTGLAVSVCFAGIFVGDKIINMGRQDSNGSASHSVFQRESFAIVSLRMFENAPMFGHGFGRFYDKKMPYLNDRSQQIELESIRALDHHNTFLSILTETGLIGLVLLLAVLGAWVKMAWKLAHDTARPTWMRAHGMFHLATLICYMVNAMFHDLTLSPSEQWLLCLVTGVTAGLTSMTYVPKRCLEHIPINWQLNAATN